MFELTGRVVSDATGEPVARALVEINFFGFRQPGPNAATYSEPDPVFTDASGIFHLRGLPPGNYGIHFTKPQFESKSEMVEIGSAPKNIEISLTRLGVVTGKVVDADGRPLRGVNIVIYRVRIADGRRSISQERSVTTDDLGEYRLWNLTPGNYVLKAAGRGVGTGLYTTDTLPSFSAAETFVPVFFGGSKDWRTATPIAWRSPSESKADFRLRLEPARRIRGTVTGQTLLRNATFELFDIQGNQVSTRAALSGTGGSFELLDVLPGSYTVRVTQGDGDAKVFGGADVAVGEADSEGLIIPLKSGVNFKIVSDCKIPQRGDAGVPCAVNLNLYRASGEQLPTNFDNHDGSGSYRNVPPGSYEFQPITFNRYVTGMLIGGRPISPNEKLPVFEGMPPVEIQTAEDGGSFAPKLDFPNAERTSDVQILAVPLFESYAGPVLIPASLAPVYKFAPGDYQIYAFAGSSQANVEYRNPEVLRTLLPGASVKIEPNGHHQVAIGRLAQ